MRRLLIGFTLVGLLLPVPGRAQESTSAPGDAPTATAAHGAEVALWTVIDRAQSIQDYEIYLEDYPQGIFASLARRRIAALSTAPSAAAPSLTVAPGTVWHGTLTAAGAEEAQITIELDANQKLRWLNASPVKGHRAIRAGAFDGGWWITGSQITVQVYGLKSTFVGNVDCVFDAVVVMGQDLSLRARKDGCAAWNMRLRAAGSAPPRAHEQITRSWTRSDAVAGN